MPVTARIEMIRTYSTSYVPSSSSDAAKGAELRWFGTCTCLVNRYLIWCTKTHSRTMLKGFEDAVLLYDVSWREGTR